MNTGEFDITRVPEKIKRETLLKMYTDEYVEELMNNSELFTKRAEPKIYLAWLWVNELVYWESPIWLEPIDGYEINHDDYELDEGGWNYETLLEIDLNAEDTRPLLEGLFLKDRLFNLKFYKYGIEKNNINLASNSSSYNYKLSEITDKKITQLW